ncbi:fimbrial protein [Providencia rettgeri]|uniref:spore coat protein U domain-containing protein n=1 Tax=Providencia TaxID=586 RepID=UPI00029BFC8D|nr:MULTISPECIES: spore coat protein U domain-containing protein [Providencia]EHZ7765958.1 fimbrial protein [Providencia rettgeri]EIJ7169100.1 fimbrial protein [Providencia rettgeri]EJD6049146.1 fimbrial protein [Providencia rettgeri]EJD6475484.1 fimbrial protein [Providencia rettgeri]EKT58854.1 fimbrial subunit [Providencia rettgeri Dmel1]
MLKRSLLISIGFIFPLYVNATSFTSNVTGGTVTSNLTMTVKASCSATVGDVAFGDRTAGDIKKGMIENKVMSLAIACDTTLANYTLTFTAADGAKDATNGIINTKGNSTIGYQLLWGDSTVKPVDTALAINGTVITPTNKPTAASFSIPIKVKPVAFGEIVSPGAANTALNIKLTFN